jgi:poly(3-hydroxybutyrate) depolymerase
VVPTGPGLLKSWGDNLLDLDTTLDQRLALIDALLTQVQASSFDSVILVGASGGAVMALQFTCSHPGTIDGLMLVAGPISPQHIATCASVAVTTNAKAAAAQAGLHVATLQVNGTSDIIAPYNAGLLGLYAGAPAVFTDLYTDNGCQLADIATAAMTDPNPLISGIGLQWVKPCSGRGSALVTINGGGHEWPGYNGPISSLSVNAFGAVATGFYTTLQGYDFLTYLGAGP